MEQGNFTELANNTFGSPVTGTNPTTNPPFIFDPTTNQCGPSGCTRQPFEYNGTYNVIPPGEISPIAQKMESFLPNYPNSPNAYLAGDVNPNIWLNNFFASYKSGYDNHLEDWRVDYDLSSNHRISTVGTMGVIGYLNNYSNAMPAPLVTGDLATLYPNNFIVEDAYTINPHLVNQLKFSYTSFFQNIFDASASSAWSATTMGITNVPAGQASATFPGASFGTSLGYGAVGLTGFTGNSTSTDTQPTKPHNYALTDNIQWLRGKHALSFGFSYQWQEINEANPYTFTQPLYLSYNTFDTGTFVTGGTTVSAGGKGAVIQSALPGTSSYTGPLGFSYASYLLGAVGASTTSGASFGGGAPSIPLGFVTELGGRYHPLSPYVEDSWKLTTKLTVEIGLRWDYLTPYHEAKDRWSFLNPTLTNPLTNTPGLLQFAGSNGGAGVSCGCKTPVQTYWKNWGPRVGFAYSLNPKTVIRAGTAIVYTQAGGVGGRADSYQGAGQTGFNVSAIGPTETNSGVAAGPSYYLNNTAYNNGYSGSTLLTNTGLFGLGFTYPAQPTANVAAQELDTGNYVVSGTTIAGASGVNFPDPHLSGRAPEIILWNFGVERGLTKDLTLSANYVGNESHFIINSGSTGGNARGLWTNEVNPQYVAVLGPVMGVASNGTTPQSLLSAPATSANVATMQAYMASAPAPAFFVAAANAKPTSGDLTIASMLTAFPQYATGSAGGGVSDIWGNVGNFSFNSLEIQAQQRMAHGFTFTANYVFSKNIGDDGTYRSGFNIPAGALSRWTGPGTHQNRIDRSWTVVSEPNIFHAFGVWKLPFGKGEIGGNNLLVRWLAGGWQLSSIYSHYSGTPIAIGTSYASSLGQGQAMPDMNPAYQSSSARQNGKYGSGPNGYQACNLGVAPIGSSCTAIAYLNSNAFVSPVNIANNSLPGCTTSTSCTTSANNVYQIGNSPRTAPYGLRNPASWDIDGGLRRSFPLHWENSEFVFEADALNAWNNVVFSGPSASAGSSAFGQITSQANSPRDWQFAGHINF